MKKEKEVMDIDDLLLMQQNLLSQLSQFSPLDDKTDANQWKLLRQNEYLRKQLTQL